MQTRSEAVEADCMETSRRSDELIGKEGFVLGDGVHGLQYASDAFALRYVSERAGGFGDIHHARALMHGEQEDADSREALMDFARGTEAIQNRHSDIQNDQVRLELQSLGESFLAIGGFPANLDAACLEH